jgi:hypothetical protein
MLSAGEISVEEAVRELRHLPYTDLGYAKVDHHRELRLGVPETVFGPGKTPQQVAGIVEELMRGDGPVLVTKATSRQFEAVTSLFSEASFHAESGLVVVRPARESPHGVVAVASAGTADLPVAEEAALTAEALALKVERLNDVGVAGLHRLLAAMETLERADAVIVVAGMDGVLPSIVGGLVAAPVVAVPTSVGYGAGAQGIAPLLTMLNSCAPGVAVVNIDNGFGAAVFVSVMLSRGT